MPAGRPSDFTQEIADAILEHIADGKSLRSICLSDDMPNKSTVFRWLADRERAEFATKYALAREAQADSLVDEMTDIADDGTNDWMERKAEEGDILGWRENGEALRRSALRISARQWMAEKLRPKKYGAKVDMNLSGSIATMPEETLDARIAQLIGKAGIAIASGAEAVPDKPK